MNEADFLEGGALNSFGEKFDFEGKEFEGQNNYKVYGTSINYLIRNNILMLTTSEPASKEIGNIKINIS